MAARVMSPHSFAPVAIAVAASEVAKVFADAGVDVYSLREYGRRPESLPILSRSVAYTKLCCCLCVSLLLLAFLLLQEARAPGLIIVAVVLLPVNQLGLNYFLNLGLVRNSTQPLILPALLTYAPFLLLLCAVFVTKASPVIPFTALVIGELMMLLAMRHRSKLPQPALNGLRGVPVREILRGAIPVGVAAAIAIIYGRLDLYMVKQSCSDSSVGLYAFASRILDPAWQLVSGWIATQGGRFARLWVSGKSEFQHLGDRLLGGGALLAVSTIVGIALFARPLLEWLFPAFSESYAAMLVLGFALLPRILNNTLTMLLISAHREKRIPVISIINLCTLSAALLVLVPKWGITGAAIAVLIAESSNTLMQWTLHRRTLAMAGVQQ